MGVWSLVCASNLIAFLHLNDAWQVHAEAGASLRGREVLTLLRNALAAVLVVTGAYDEAAALLAPVVEDARFPHSAFALQSLGSVALKKYDLARAEACFAAAADQVCAVF